MFTGLIETIGTITTVARESQSVRIGVRPAVTPYPVADGDSVALSGVCLTLESASQGALWFRAVAETLSKSSLELLRPGDTVNLERAITPTTRLGGHFVLGHVDCVGTISSDRSVGDSLLRTFSVPPELMHFMAAKGSVAIDGISLTIAELGEQTITVSLIPYSLAHTTMSSKRVGEKVNIEIDVLARYTARLLGIPESKLAAGTPVRESLGALLERSGF